jgi:hypothetical protein
VGGTKPAANATANQFFRQATVPTGGTVNDIWFNTSNNSTYFFNGTNWVLAGDVTSNNEAASIAGQGSFATLNQITSGNIASYMGPSAISTTYIANLAVSSAKIANLAVGSAQMADLSVQRLKITSYPFTNGSAAMSAGATGDITVTHNLGRNVLPVILWNSPPSSIISITLTYSDSNSFRFRMNAMTTASGSGYTGTVFYQYMYL